MIESGKRKNLKYRILLLKGWYLILGSYFLILFILIYFLNLSEFTRLIDTLVYFSIGILVISMLFSILIPYILRKNMVILQLLAFSKAIFYGFLLIFGSLYLNFYVLTGPLVPKIEFLLGINLIIVSFTSFFEFYFLWNYVLDQTISEKDFSKFQVWYLILAFSSCVVGLYYLSQPLFLSTDSLVVSFLFFNIIAGDAFIGVGIERLNEYWNKFGMFEHPSSKKNHKNAKSILFSEKLYISLIFIYILFACLYVFPLIIYSSIISSRMRDCLNIIIGTKWVLLIIMSYVLTKQKTKEIKGSKQTIPLKKLPGGHSHLFLLV